MPTPTDPPADATDTAAEIERLRERVADLEARLALVQELTHSGIFERDPATMQGRWDDSLYRIYGLPVPPPGTPAPSFDQLAGMMLEADRTPGGFVASMATPGAHSARVRIRRPDGAVRHIHSQWKVSHDSEGRATRVVGVNADDTEVFELSQRLEMAAEAARIGLWSTSTLLTRPRWNRRMFELFGLDPALPPLEFGEWMRRCVYEQDRERVAEHVIPWMLAGSAPIDIEFRIVRADDAKVRWIVVRGQASEVQPGGERRLEGIALDVTEQHETLRHLRETVERVDLTATALGLGTWESEGPQAMVVWDEQMFRLRGTDSPRRGVTRGEVASYVHPDDRETVMTGQDRRMLNGQPWSTEFRVKWSDGTVRWLASRSVPLLDEAGREVRRIGLNFDITEARLAANAVREREFAMAESRAKSRFMSRISHELRTPLNAVMGFTQLLRDDSRSADAGQRERWLGHVDEAARHLLALIDDVLDLSHAESGDMRLNLQDVAVAALVSGTLPLVAREAEARGIDVAVDTPLAGTVRADPVRLRQVLLNLLSNAIKYNRPGGQVRVSTAAAGTHVTFRVADTGPGIAPDKLRDAFEPFNRLGAEAGPVEGTGIGLAVAKALVEQMGGEIGVASQPGEGSVFSVALAAGGATACVRTAPPSQGAAVAAPSAAGSAAPSAAPPADASGNEPARLLYIEDNPVNALLLVELLAGRPGVTLDTAADGLEGLRRARDGQPHLVLVDMHLPDMDGIAVLRALRAHPDTADVPCVALSANAMRSDIDAALAAGFVAYWTKPFDFDRLLAGLAEVLGRPV